MAYQRDRAALFGAGSGAPSPTPQSRPTRAAPTSIPPAVSARARADAEELRTEATKLVKKGKGFKLFWSPDPDRAAPIFAKAAHKFKAAGMDDEAKACFTESASCQLAAKPPAFASAAMNLSAAAKIAQGEEAVSLWEQGSSALIGAMDSQRAADFLVQGAKHASTFDLDTSARLYNAACDLIVAPQTGEIGGSVLGGEIIQAARDWFLNNGRLRDALGLAARHIVVLKHHEQRTSLHKAYCAQTILELGIGDVVRADRSYLDHLQDTEYLRADEAQIAEDLIRSFKMNDPALLETTLANHKLTFLDPPIVQLARSLAIQHDFAVEVPTAEDSSKTAQSSVGDASTLAADAADDNGAEEELDFDLT